MKVKKNYLLQDKVFKILKKHRKFNLKRNLQNYQIILKPLLIMNNKKSYQKKVIQKIKKIN